MVFIFIKVYGYVVGAVYDIIGYWIVGAVYDVRGNWIVSVLYGVHIHGGCISLWAMIVTFFLIHESTETYLLCIIQDFIFMKALRVTHNRVRLNKSCLVGLTTGLTSPVACRKPGSVHPVNLSVFKSS